MTKEFVPLTCEHPGRRGRRIPRDVIVQLVARGAGFCYRPECPTGFLWHELEDGTAVKLAQVAHVVAASPQGPRANPDAPDDALTSIRNLVLLCPTCHVIVDHAPGEFPVERIDQWKREHEARVAAVWGIRRFANRTELHGAVQALLNENHAIWSTYGPESEAAASLAPDAPAAWRREMVRTVIPNNARILRLLDENTLLLSESEAKVVAQFRLHAKSLEDRHLSGVTNSAAPRFPPAMNVLLNDREG